ncbi:hypothetical protein EV361DRAFT_1038030 [Lentinula raphanica]|nr:hypothetical protein EV361DRAFT_1038030 [Lentinula raphanica]
MLPKEQKFNGENYVSFKAIILPTGHLKGLHLYWEGQVVVPDSSNPDTMSKPSASLSPEKSAETASSSPTPTAINDPTPTTLEYELCKSVAYLTLWNNIKNPDGLAGSKYLSRPDPKVAPDPAPGQTRHTRAKHYANKSRNVPDDENDPYASNRSEGGVCGVKPTVSVGESDGCENGNGESESGGSGSEESETSDSGELEKKTVEGRGDARQDQADPSARDHQTWRPVDQRGRSVYGGGGVRVDYVQLIGEAGVQDKTGSESESERRNTPTSWNCDEMTQSGNASCDDGSDWSGTPGVRWTQCKHKHIPVSPPPAGELEAAVTGGQGGCTLSPVPDGNKSEQWIESGADGPQRKGRRPYSEHNGTVGDEFAEALRGGSTVDVFPLPNAEEEDELDGGVEWLRGPLGMTCSEGCKKGDTRETEDKANQQQVSAYALLRRSDERKMRTDGWK